ncbi:unnamed protein product [Prorocentrum cordatum]|uniref:Phospholipase B-like n=1 Tax=Prorocentrum cordatum TaxID=2364126 RepID=A0ABN9SYK5_9DINO|nr:unnamed protein product [Polarella glacialis]
MYSSTNAPAQQAAYMPENNFAMGGLSKGFFEPRPRREDEHRPNRHSPLRAGGVVRWRVRVDVLLPALHAVDADHHIRHPVLLAGALDWVLRRPAGEEKSHWSRPGVHMVHLLVHIVARRMELWVHLREYQLLVIRETPYYNVNNLMTYTSIDPSAYRGQQLMDAGRVVFTSDSALNTNYLGPADFSGFRNAEMYCVAPIVTQVNGTYKKQDTYDFWAVGTECCTSKSFLCGDYNNANAHGGLRLTSDSDRAFYRLAVQQAEAAFHIKAVHPLFFTWTQDHTDPIGSTNDYLNDAIQYFITGVFIFFVVQLFTVACAVIVFSRLGSL